MADDAKTDSSVEVIDEAVSAAAGTRQAAKWIASALGGIPGLAIVGSIITGPGDAGYSTVLLFVGIGLAAAGAPLGILFLADVLTPIPLTDEQLTGFGMSQVPGCLVDTFEKLTDRITDARRLAAGQSDAATEADAAAKLAEGAATAAEAAAKQAAELCEKAPTSAGAKQAALHTRSEAESRRTEAGSLAGEAAAQAVYLTLWERRLAALEWQRGQALRLKAADEVRHRFKVAQYVCVLAVAFVAAGLACMALAPRTEDAGSAPSLVTMTLTSAGQDALHYYSKSTLQGLRIGGDDTAPLIITFPEDDYPSRLIRFIAASPSPMGTVKTEPTPEAP